MDDTPVDETPLDFDEFPDLTAEEWQAAAVASLGGKPLEKLITPSYEGIPIRPLYRREDVANLQFTATLPDQPPYVRGYKVLFNRNHVQPFDLGRPADFNRALQAYQKSGGILTMLLDRPTRAGLDPDAAAPGEVGHGGLSLVTVDDVAEAFRDWLIIRVFAHCGATALPMAALFLAYCKNNSTQSTGIISPVSGFPLVMLGGSLAADPLGVLAEEGTLPLPLEKAYDQMAHLARWMAFSSTGQDTVAVRTDIYHEAGANATQELAFGLATGAAYLRAQFARVGDIDIAAQSIRFHFAIGGQFFMEVAKLRAARLLWAQVVAAFGGNEESTALHVDARTARRNKTAIDPHVNMLRATTEALAADIGGADSISVAPFDEPLGAPDDFSRRIAHNVQIILQDEAQLKRLIDPAGGSYAVESLTDELARAAWKLFQEIEAQGGMAAALESGFVQSSIAAVAAKRAAALAKRRDVLVGVNQFANPAEKPRPAAPPADDTLYTERTAQLAAHRAGRDNAACAAALAQLTQVMAAAPERVVEAAIAAAEAGATLGELAAALRQTDRPGPTVTPLPQLRLAAPFEALRRAAFDYAEVHGHPPRLFLANLGPPRQHKARADFTQGFFEVGGFQVITNNGFATPDEAAAAALASGAPAVAVCSTDETYPELVPPLAAAIKSAAPATVIILAGRPADQVEALRAAGVDEFIYMGADALAINSWLHNRIAPQP